IFHFGRSSWKWSHTDIYRYQNGGFYLIGYASHAGRNCDYWINMDFNLITGKIIIEKEYQECKGEDQSVVKRENEIMFKKGLKINLENRNEKEIKIISPKYKHEIYISFL
ncbi:MAG: hypothetical protein ACRCVT_10190, partial [Leadbetterella sp.]